MTDDENIHPDLFQLIQGDENKSKEYKSATVLREPNEEHKYKISKQLVAFANRNGGKLIFGVDDSGNIEDKDLDEEMSLGTISTLARMKCQPPIEFSYTYYSQSQNHTTEGDVFVVEIEPRRSIPHAVVENSNGEIRKREYRIRAGDESRLVTDEELNWLFQNKLSELGETYRTHFWVIFNEEGNPVASPPAELGKTPHRYRPTTVTRGSRYITHFIDSLPEDQLSEMNFDESPLGLTSYISDITPFSLLMSLSRVLRPTWKVDWVQSSSSHQLRDYEKVDTEIPMTKIELDDIIVDNNGLTLPHLGIDPVQLLKDWTNDTDYLLSLPEGSEVIIKLDEEISEFPAISVSSTSLIIKKEDLFTFSIDCSWDESGRDYPVGHPEFYRKSSKDPKSEITSIQIDTEYTSHYGVPDVQDPFLEDHQNLGKNIKKVLEEDWNAGNLTKNRKNEVIFEIDGKLDSIINELEDLN